MDVSDCIDDYQNDQNNDDYDIDDQNDDDYDDQNDNRNYEWKSTTLLHCRCRNPRKIPVRTSLRAEKRKIILSFDILDLYKCGWNLILSIYFIWKCGEIIKQCWSNRLLKNPVLHGIWSTTDIIHFNGCPKYALGTACHVIFVSCTTPHQTTPSNPHPAPCKSGNNRWKPCCTNFFFYAAAFLAAVIMTVFWSSSENKLIMWKGE